MTRDDLPPALARLFSRGIAYDLGGVNVVMDACHVVALVHASSEIRNSVKHDIRTQHLPGFRHKMPMIRRMNGEPMVVNLQYLREVLDVLDALGARTISIRTGTTAAQVPSDWFRTMPLLMEIIPYMDSDTHESLSATRARFLLAGVVTVGYEEYMTEANGEYPKWSRGAFEDALAAEWFQRMDKDGG